MKLEHRLYIQGAVKLRILMKQKAKASEVTQDEEE